MANSKGDSIARLSRKHESERRPAIENRRYDVKTWRSVNKSKLYKGKIGAKDLARMEKAKGT